MQDILATLVAFKAVIVGAWFLLWFAGENLRPAAPAPSGGDARRRWLSNAALFIVNTGLSPLVVLPVTLWAASNSLDWRPRPDNVWLALAIDIVLLDLFIYAWHRANHEIQFLWRFHEVHHLDQHLDATTAVRFHFGEVLLSAIVRGAFIILLGMPIQSVIIFEVTLLIASIFHHSNARLPTGVEKALSFVIITPSLHWVHHHAIRADTDSTYGTLFSFWDRLFGSSSPTRRTPEMRIGVEGDHDRPLQTLLLRPFQKRNDG